MIYTCIYYVRSFHFSLQIAFKDAFMGPKAEKKKLLPVIAQNDRADTDLVKDFCQYVLSGTVGL